MNENEVSHLKWLLEKQLHWISSADSKLAVLVPLPLAMLAISLSVAAEAFAQITWNDAPLIVSTVLLCLGLFFTKAALTPRLNGPSDSTIFFGKIATLTEAEFLAIFESSNEAEFKRDLIQQVYRNAHIALIKHCNVGRCITCLALATPLWLLAIVMGG